MAWRRVSMTYISPILVSGGRRDTIKLGLYLACTVIITIQNSNASRRKCSGCLAFLFVVIILESRAL